MRQCKTEADLHREWARVLDMCEGTKVNQQDCWKCDGIKRCVEPMLRGIPKSYSFAIAIVENKPVFIGDELYYTPDGEKVTVTGISSVKTPYGVHLLYVIRNKCGACSEPVSSLSWNPPKPKTVLLEVSVECAEWYVDALKFLNGVSAEVPEAAKKALAKLNEEQ